jgi:hypothetical protein
VDAVEQPEDLLWDEEESAALRQARKDATLSASADSVREYLKQIGKVALLTAEQEVALAARRFAHALSIYEELDDHGGIAHCHKSMNKLYGDRHRRGRFGRLTPYFSRFRR